jgi:hypothetical protein
MISDVRSFVFYWNTLYPIDLWWRIRHKTPFNSSAHREMCMIDMMFEYVEHQLVYAKPEKESSYNPGMGNWLNEQIKTQEEIDKEFDSISLDDIQL